METTRRGFFGFLAALAPAVLVAPRLRAPERSQLPESSETMYRSDVPLHLRAHAESIESLRAELDVIYNISPRETPFMYRSR